jgi:protoheme ferro-lyase
MDTRHVVLITYGEPPTPGFREQLTYSWRILVGLTRTVAPIPVPLLPLIAVLRARGRTTSWRREGYASPLEPITDDQARALERVLSARDRTARWRVHVAYEFRRPLLQEVLGRLDGRETVCVAPMYAADSAFTHELSRTTLAARAPHAGAARAGVLPAIDAERLADVSAAHVREQVRDRPEMVGPDVALVLAAHGTLLEPPKPINTGLEATQRLCDAIARRLAPEFGLIVNGWLNHTRGGRWTEPAIDLALSRVADAGFRRVVYFPYGFLADNAESQLEGVLALRTRPQLEALHLPCLNASPALAGLIADQVLEAAARMESVA